MEIQKLGPSSIEEVQLKLEIPTTVSTHNILQIQAINFYYKGQPIICNNSATRNRRDITSTQSTELITSELPTDLPKNRTLTISCGSKDVECESVQCSVGPFLDTQNIAMLHLKMIIETYYIRKLMGARDFLVLQTHGTVSIVSPRNVQSILTMPQNVVDIPSIFNVGFQKQEVPWWIIIGSIVAGILLLVLVSYGLAKVQFGGIIVLEFRLILFCILDGFF